MADPLIPPSDLEAEAAFLGSILLDPAELAHVNPLPRPEDFYSPRHAALWRCMAGLHGQGVPPDALLVYREAERRGLLDEIGGREYPATLAAEVSSPVHAPEYAKVVREKAKARALIRVAQALEAQARGGEDADVAHKRAQEALYALGSADSKRGASHLSDAIYELLGILDRGEKKKGVVPTSVSTLNDLMAGGLHPGELTLVAARPGGAKTTMGLNVIREASKSGIGCLVFSLEMDAKMLASNMIAAEAQVMSDRMRKGRDFLGEIGMAKVHEAAATLGNRRIWVNDSSVSDVSDIRREVLRVHAKEGLGLVVADYVGLIGGLEGDSREEVVSNISRSLKVLARDTGLPILAMAQLNRQSEQREGNRPRLSDLRESGGLEANADVVMLLHRPWVYSRLEAEREELQIILAKNRHGPVEQVRARFVPEFLLITDPKREQ